MKTSDIGSAKKFLALALTAYANKQYEDAGAMFSQACECAGDSVPTIVNSLLEQVPAIPNDTQQEIETSNLQQLAGDESEEGDGESDEDDFDGEGDADEEGEGDVRESTSSAKPRRQVTSLARIGSIIAASMEATASENEEPLDENQSEIENENEDDSPVDSDVDEDVPGEDSIPVSFSSETVTVVTSTPLKLKS